MCIISTAVGPVFWCKNTSALNPTEHLCLLCIANRCTLWRWRCDESYHHLLGVCHTMTQIHKLQAPQKWKLKEYIMCWMKRCSSCGQCRSVPKPLKCERCAAHTPLGFKLQPYFTWKIVTKFNKLMFNNDTRWSLVAWLTLVHSAHCTHAGECDACESFARHSLFDGHGDNL